MFVHEVCIIKQNNQRQIYKNIFISHPLTTLYVFAHVQLLKAKQRSEKGSNFKEDDRALPL